MVEVSKAIDRSVMKALKRHCNRLMAEEKALCLTCGVPEYPDLGNDRQLRGREWISQRFAERVRRMTHQAGTHMHDLKLSAFDDGRVERDIDREKTGIGRYFRGSDLTGYWISAKELHFAIFD